MDKLTRREFLQLDRIKKGIEEIKKKGDGLSCSLCDVKREHHYQLTRREALKLFAGFGVGMALVITQAQDTVWAALNKELDSVFDGNRTEGDKKELSFFPNTFGQILKSTLQIGAFNLSGKICDFLKINKGSYKETAIQASLLLGAEIVAGKVFESFGINHGNQTISEEEWGEMLNRPFESYIELGVFAPIIEEIMFRFYPSLAVDLASAEHRKK